MYLNQNRESPLKISKIVCFPVFSIPFRWDIFQSIDSRKPTFCYLILNAVRWICFEVKQDYDFWMPLNLQASDFKYLSEVDYLTLIAYRSCIFLSTNTVILSHESVCFVCLNFHLINVISILAKHSVGRWSSFKEVLFEKLLCRACSLLLECVPTRVMTSTRKNHESYEKLAASFSPRIFRSNENHSVQCITTSIRQVLNSRSVKLGILTGRKWCPLLWNHLHQRASPSVPCSLLAWSPPR